MLPYVAITTGWFPMSCFEIELPEPQEVFLRNISSPSTFVFTTQTVFFAYNNQKSYVML